MPEHAVILAKMAMDVDAGRVRAAVRTVLEFADERMHACDWLTLDLLMRDADTDKLGATASLGILSATYPARQHTTAARTALIERLRDSVKRAFPDRHIELMRGVE